MDVWYLRVHNFAACNRIHPGSENSEMFRPGLPTHAVLFAIDYGCSDVFLLGLNQRRQGKTRLVRPKPHTGRSCLLLQSNSRDYTARCDSFSCDTPQHQQVGLLLT